MSESCCMTMNNEGDIRKYWDDTFHSNEIHNWSEKSTPSMARWIDSSVFSKDAVIFCAGVGDSLLVDYLLGLGYTNIIANDISKVALERVKNRIGDTAVQFVPDDLMNPSDIHKYHGTVDLYIDRATLHFFTTCKEKDFYFAQKMELLKQGGKSILGVFSKDNEPKCCGLDLQLWSMESLKNRMPQYDFIEEYSEVFVENNDRKRNYIYLFSEKR